MFEEMAEKMSAAGVIPVVTVKDVDATLEIASKASEKGIDALEITFRTTQGEKGHEMICEAIKAVRKKFPELLVGAGSMPSLPPWPKMQELSLLFHRGSILKPWNGALPTECLFFLE